MYYFNVCGDANLVPAACVSLEKAVQVRVAPFYFSLYARSQPDPSCRGKSEWLPFPTLLQAPAYQVASNDDCFWLGRCVIAGTAAVRLRVEEV